MCSIVLMQHFMGVFNSSDAAFSAWTFATVKNWGEPPVGVWKLDITSNPKSKPHTTH